MVNRRGRHRLPLSRHRKSSFFSITFYVILIFSLSIFTFLLYSSYVLQEENKVPLLRVEKPKINKLLDDQLWKTPSGLGLRQCVKRTSRYGATPVSDHYITVKSNGGLNQMRTGIADMVAVARIMNATLVIPQLDKSSFWQDSSTFSNIFDETHFIKSLEKDVRIVKRLPKELESLPRARKHFTSWGGLGYYEEMTTLWKEYQIIHVAKSDSRLANNDLPLDIQRLRCRALYHALRFSPSIESLGKKLVERLRSRAQRYIALHLRYEKDMLSFTGCTYGLTVAESEELRTMREKTSHWKVKNINPTEQRDAGLCPLTPKEEMLATPKELKDFSNHASQTAALDYIISIESDIFVPSHSGNMARAVEGHRRFLGHRKTITPDRKSLVQLFDLMEAGQLEESSLSLPVMQLHRQRFGGPRRRGSGPPGIKGRVRLRLEESFYQNPYPECICKS
ncbi:O-fucosyltransferase 38-like isoform X2 [Salvia hispanica]|uniref:O-fucosyltransferase 38-like isoform X2 n=1 Tax=Salvia hispanica TaxID=49212 RepID=UPI0020090D31|nr:O-fucosyltransferase 38-like isoform X2 [Salvia hispanica]